MYGIDLNNNKDRYFTIGENKRQIFAFLPLKRQITISKVAPVKLELEGFKSEQLNEAEISLHLTYSQENELSALLYNHKKHLHQTKNQGCSSIADTHASKQERNSVIFRA
ncbi:hypothetical protein O181_088843 [Austropuccinia psidii MF-1]|uniref:Uncharacterized protein n=1 Tax=Austropuccinia psidii MF-1 TaxID=1389203 RepID=A0A9Q3IS76_9BASI|nr:hypothetical protein [Austropuccinia psidii MF-1]